MFLLLQTPYLNDQEFWIQQFLTKYPNVQMVNFNLTQLFEGTPLMHFKKQWSHNPSKKIIVF